MHLWFNVVDMRQDFLDHALLVILHCSIHIVNFQPCICLNFIGYTLPGANMFCLKVLELLFALHPVLLNFLRCLIFGLL